MTTPLTEKEREDELYKLENQAFDYHRQASSVMKEYLKKCRILANEGNARAGLGLCHYHNTNFCGLYTRLSTEEVMRYANQAIKAGYVRGHRYIFEETKDETMKKFHLMQGAIGGDVECIWSLAGRYERGYGGFEVDLDRAAQWYRVLSTRDGIEPYRALGIFEFFTGPYREKTQITEQLQYAKAALKLEIWESTVRTVIIFLRSLLPAQRPNDVLSWFETVTVPVDMLPIFPSVHDLANKDKDKDKSC